MSRTRIAVLASGGGSNLQAILDHFDELGARRRGDVVMVASDRADAGALERSRVRGIAAEHVPVASRADAPAHLGELLTRHAVDLLVLAGYLRRVPEDVVHRYAGRIVNVHPALLPAFGGAGMYGRRVHEAVLAAGVTVTGVSIHFIDEEYDRGTIIAQWPVPVLRDDDATTLAARVLRVEHLLYPRVVNAVAGGAVTLAACRSGRRLDPASGTTFRMFSQEDDCLADDIDRALGC
jgi:formyltetrahydrofolate-dependent phosphoribosylglycinamide formyltransferase